MKRSTNTPIYILLCLNILLLSGCGIFTKTYHGNGLKFNGESGLFSKQQDDSFYLKKYYAKKALNKAASPETDQASDAVTKQPMATLIADTLAMPLLQKVAIDDTPGEIKQVETHQEINSEHNADSTKPVTGIKDIGYDANAKAAGWLFYGGMIMRVGALFLISLNPIFSLIFILLTAAMLAGFVLAIISLVRIKDERRRANYLRGRGLSLSIIILFALGILLTLATIALYIAILASLL